NQLNICIYMYKGYEVTIIVEGGLGTLEVLENDIKEKRPIVLIQGSGRLADILAMLIEQISNPDRNQPRNPSEKEIEQALDRFYPNVLYSDVGSAIKRIQKILIEENRYLFHVFSMDRDKNVAETIFKAIFTVTKKKNELEYDPKNKNGSWEQEEQRQKGEDKLVDLALEWNYFDGALPILLARQDEIMKTESELMKIQNEIMIQENVSKKANPILS
ncbi:unnamed protein product, partial [Rotaria sordida]